MEQVWGKNVKVFIFDGFFPIFQFVAFMQHCPAEAVRWSIFQRSSYFEFAHIYSKNSIEGNYLFKVNDTITKTRSVICWKFTIETPKYCFSALIVNFQQISHFLFMFLFVPFEQVIAGKECLYFKYNFQLQLMVK